MIHELRFDLGCFWAAGASGDLAPLSHLALDIMGEGRAWSPSTGWGDAQYVEGLKAWPSPIMPRAK